MQSVKSKDGTTIAFDRTGKGPVIVLVGGALGTRSHPMQEQLVRELEPHFTVVNYDRRGRGDSGDTQPFAVDREIEDIEAVIDANGGSACVYGISSGAVLALEAASKLSTRVERLALYEPPFILDDSRPPLPSDYVQQLNEAIEAGRPGDPVEIFMTQALLIPDEYLDPMKSDPSWAKMEEVAHTLAYDGMVVRDTMAGKPLPATAWSTATMPTLVMTGGESEPFFHTAAKSLVEILPQTNHHSLEGQDHAVDPAALAPVLVAFLKGNVAPG